MNNTLIFLPWDPSSDNSSFYYGTLAFALLSLDAHFLGEAMNGIEDPVVSTMTFPVFSWLANNALST